MLPARPAPAGCAARRAQSPRLDHFDYTAGDDYRQIDWKLCARHDELRTFAPPARDERLVYLLLDVSASMAGLGGAKFAVARQWAGGLAAIALAGGARVAGAAIGRRVEAQLPPVCGSRQAAALSRFFDPLAPSSCGTDLRAAIDGFLRLGLPPGLAIVVSDFFDPPGFAPALDALVQARFEPLVAQVVAPEDARPELRGPVELFDVESGRSRRVTLTAADLARYRRHFARFEMSLAQYCARRGLARVRIDTAAGADVALRQLMRPGVWSPQFRRRV